MPALQELPLRDPEPRSLILEQTAGRHEEPFALRGGGVAARLRGDFIRQSSLKGKDYRVDSAYLQLNDRSVRGSPGRARSKSHDSRVERGP